MSIEQKHCNGCNQLKLTSLFPRNRRSKDGFDWRCKECKRKESQRYIHSDKGRATRRHWYETHRPVLTDTKREKRAQYNQENPEKIRSRNLVGNAVRRGYIPKPEDSRNWHNRWEFHHPDYNRPYYGVWVKVPEHRRIDNGTMECPPCTDYTQQVFEGLMRDWALRAVGVDV